MGIYTLGVIGAGVAPAAAAARASERCAAEMQQFEAGTASVAEMQAYADCVNLLHPREISGPELFGLQWAAALALIGALIGIWRARARGPVYWCWWGLLGALLLPAAAGLLATAVGARFLP